MNSHRDNPQKTEVFYRDLKQLHQQLQKKHSIVLLGGDFNAKLGMKQNDLEVFIGNYGKGSRNENGELLTDFLLEEKLFSCQHRL